MSHVGQIRDIVFFADLRHLQTQGSQGTDLLRIIGTSFHVSGLQDLKYQHKLLQHFRRNGVKVVVMPFLESAGPPEEQQVFHSSGRSDDCILTDHTDHPHGSAPSVQGSTGLIYTV